MRKILYAFRFLTILPIPWKQDEDLKQVARSMIYFPFVGFIIGTLLICFEYLLKYKISPLGTSTILIFLWMFFTGGLHLDGLADLADGMGGKNREDRLRIMKDSQIGAFGALWLIAIIIFKIVILREIILLDIGILLYPLLLAPIWGRLMELLAIRFFNSARKDGMGNFFKVEMRLREWFIPLVGTCGITIFLLGITSVFLITPFLIIIFCVSNSISKKLGGLTGDCYGAICEISELLFLFLFLLLTVFGIL